MPRLWIKIIFLIASNMAALFAAAYFVDGFEISPNLVDFAIVAAIFTFINAFIKPIIKLVLSPMIIITLGLALIFVNAFMLYFLDFISDGVSINGIIPLVYATIIISIVHFITGFLMKRII